jgi:hypothetical protein
VAVALVALAKRWNLAIVVFRVSIRGSVARHLSLLLVAAGATLISAGYADLFLTEKARSATGYGRFHRAEEVVHTIGGCLIFAL